PHLDDLPALADELSLFADRDVELFSAWEIPPAQQETHDPTFSERLRVLKRFASGERQLVVSSIHGLLQPTPDKAAIEAGTRTLKVGQTVDLEELTRWLVEHGLRNMTAVELPGEFAPRGGLLDLYAPDGDEPVRIEFFDDQIESIRRFDLGTQRSLSSLQSVDLTLLPAETPIQTPFLNHLPPDAWLILVEPKELEEHARRWLGKLSRRKGLYTVESVLKKAFKTPTAIFAQIPGGALSKAVQVHTESVERYQGKVDHLADLLASREDRRFAANEQQIFLVCPTEQEVDRLIQTVGPVAEQHPGKLHFPHGRLRAGFRLLDPPALFLSGGELLGRKGVPSRASQKNLGRSIDSFLELREGDYVIHLSHGIGRYEGMRLLEKEHLHEEHLEIEFHGGARVYVPVSKIDLVQKYVGGTNHAPQLARIGGKLWARKKEQAEEAVMDLASDMLDLHAQRAARPGIAFKPDSAWQATFEGNFPYHETPDQLTSLVAIKKDMEQPRSMDRLLCGDVGFGKTEVAMRAAFKAIDSGYQVAVLVPTTILAEQHYRSFKARMDGFPFQIRALSRFRTKAEQKEILSGLADGSVDLVVGTHRLVQGDIAFQNLGLVVVDEEQKFGVEAKDKLKILRTIVDVLTLTATPIPRTLHMSLLGVRDISNLETPPADRLPVETRVTRWDPTLVEYAVRRELARGGQVFFIHNRISDLPKIRDTIKALVPEARIGIGHGQMPEDELSQVMVAFMEHEYDILLSTTIVESGLDIPIANTMFIDDADRYGLAELHQLRGRVGRYKHRAYCYLLVNAHGTLSPDAQKRLKAIEEFSSLGAGFGIAMRDLEIRGAGNILGTEQSGHISAVGYELYCKMLEKAVRELKKMGPEEKVEVHLDLPGEAYFPKAYVPDIRLKIDLYRRLSRVTNEKDLGDIQQELTDRFGRPPEVVQRLLRHARLRIWAHLAKIKQIRLEGPYAVLHYKSKNDVAQLVLRSKGKLRVVDAVSAYLPLSSEKVGAETLPSDQVLDRLEALLRPK
ncbi:MAG TPA: transcription-repair coupling factor, partial [Pirellulales bacterium]